MGSAWTATVAGAVLFAWTTGARADLAVDYTAVVAKRVSLEDAALSLDAQLVAAAQRQEALEARFQKCRDEVWSVYWEANRRKGEKQRQTLEDQRSALELHRRRTEQERVKLEARRQTLEQHYRGRSRGAAYETEFLAYISDFEERYIGALEGTVFPGYADYLKGIEGYTTFIDESVTRCETRDLTAAAIDATDAGIAQIKEAVSSLLHRFAQLSLGPSR